MNFATNDYNTHAKKENKARCTHHQKQKNNKKIREGVERRTKREKRWGKEEEGGTAEAETVLQTEEQTLILKYLLPLSFLKKQVTNLLGKRCRAT